MNRRGFLKGAGVAAVSAAFVPFIHADSRARVAPPRLPEALPVPAGRVPAALSKLPMRGQSHKHIFVSKYSGLRIQIARDMALQFKDGVYRTNDPAIADAIRKVRKQDEHTLNYDVVEFGVERIPAGWFRGGTPWA